MQLSRNFQRFGAGKALKRNGSLADQRSEHRQNKIQKNFNPIRNHIPEENQNNGNFDTLLFSKFQVN